MKPETERALASAARGEKERAIFSKVARVVCVVGAINFIASTVMWIVLVELRPTGRGLYTVTSKGRPVSVSLPVFEYITLHERITLFSLILVAPAALYLAFRRWESIG